MKLITMGSGAFLISLSEKSRIWKFLGIDNAEGLIDIAEMALPSGNWIIGVANEMSITPGYRHVVSHGVFYYFRLDYEEEVLKKKVSRANKSIGIFDIPDLEFREQSDLVRRDKLSEAEYEKNYARLEHTSYDRNWFRGMTEKLHFEIEELDNSFPNFAQARFRFEVVLKEAS